MAAIVLRRMRAVGGSLFILGLVQLPVVMADPEADSAATARSLAAMPADTAAVGSLREVGTYPNEHRDYVVAALGSGVVLVYGSNGIGQRQADNGPPPSLRDFDARARAASHYKPDYRWDPQQKIWHKVESAPECGGRRYLHTATVLPDGKALISGGLCDKAQPWNEREPYPPYKALSLWDGASAKWESAPALGEARLFHSASLLPDGGVLFIGGESDPALGPDNREPVLHSVERYRGGKMEMLAPLQVARAKHTATVLADGSVLVAGGYDDSGKAIAAVELFDATLQTWRTLAPLRTARHDHSATLLEDGRVMVAGGTGADGVPLASVETWDPATAAWSSAEPLLLPLQGHAAVRLANGNVLLAGGTSVDERPLRATMLWHKDNDTWSPAGSRMSLPWADKESQAVTLVAAADGSARVFGPRAILHWTPAAVAPASYPNYEARTHYATAMGRDGKVLISGGWVGKTSVDWAEVYDPASGRFSLTGRMHQARGSHAALTLADGRVVVADGLVSTPERPQEYSANSPEVWDPATGRWELIRGIRFGATDRVYMGQLADGAVLFFTLRMPNGNESQPPAEFRAWWWHPAQGRLVFKNVPLAPRVRAAVAVLSDGQVLVAGGSTLSFVPAYECPPAERHAAPVAEEAEGEGCRDEPAYWAEYPAASAELWDSRSGAVTTLGEIPGLRMENPRALQLRSGDVAVIDFVPAHPYRPARAAPVLVWQPAARSWRQLPALDASDSWPMVELQDGTLATLKHRLAPAAEAWSTVGAIQEGDAHLFALAADEQLALSLAPPHAATYDAGAARWQLSPLDDRAPRWLSRPALRPLADGRLMAVGQVEAGSDSVSTAHIWNPLSAAWSKAGRLARRYGQPSQAVELPSGRVLHLGHYNGQQVCEIWRPLDNRWTFCGSFTPETKGKGQPVLGNLDDGRALLMFGKSEAFLWSESSDEWVKVALDWSNEQLSYGTPIRPARPLARLQDIDGRTWVDASAVAAEYWQRNVDGVSPRIHWNRKKHEWDYVFQVGVNPMGPYGTTLPDGCVLSWTKAPWTIFNPLTGKVTQHNEPGSGIDLSDGNAAVLADGTLVLVSARYGAPGGTNFFQRKVGCGGIESHQADAALMPPLLQPDWPPVSNSAAPAAVVTEQPWTERLKRDAWNYRWLLLAIAGPLAAYFLLGRVLLPAGRRLATRIAPRGGDTARVGSRGFRWSLRALLYGVALIVALPLALNILHSRRLAVPDDCPWRPAACIDQRSGIMAPLPELADGSAESARTTLPCRFVGVWSSIRPGAVYRITLQDDGRYVMAPNESGAGSRDGYSGYWAVQGNNMIWRHEQGNTGEPDVNPMQIESETVFILTEVNGSKTRFERIRAIDSTSCSP